MSDTAYYVIATLGALVAIGNTFFIKPIRDRLSGLEYKMDNRYTKDETVEAIEIRQDAIRGEIKHLSDGIDSLNLSIQSLTETVKTLQLWQYKRMGKEEGP